VWSAVTELAFAMMVAVMAAFELAVEHATVSVDVANQTLQACATAGELASIPSG
jgi:hypothetical protein